MIQRILKYEYKCDFCGEKKEFYNDYVPHYERARVNGWAISRNRAHCYCPSCAPKFRYTGKMTARTMYEIKHAGEKK